MAKGNKQVKQYRMAVDELAEGLKRKDAERAVGALLKLEAGFRAPHLERAAPLFRDHIHRLFVASQWPELVFWAARAEREERLLSVGASSEQEREVRWELFWGCLRSNEWVRARKHLELLRPALTDTPLTAALESYIAAMGKPDGEQFVHLVAALPQPDTRLGYDARQQRNRAVATVITPPVHVEQVEGKVLQCYGTYSFEAFSSTVEQWAFKAEAQVASKIRLLGVELAAGTLLSRMGDSRRHLHEPALFIARACQQEHAPAEMKEEVLLVLRALSAGLSADSAGLPLDSARVLISVSDAAIQYPELEPLIVHMASSLSFLPETHPAALQWMERLLGRTPSATVWFKGFDLWFQNRQLDPPAWLVQSLERVLDHKGELRDAVRPRLVDPKFADQFDVIAERMPLPLAERALEEAWQGADETSKNRLADAYETLLASARFEAMYRESGPDNLSPRDVLELKRCLGMGDEAYDEMALQKALQSPIGAKLRNTTAMLFDEDDRVTPLPIEVLPLWNRVKERLMPYRISFLEMALANARTPQEGYTATEKFLEGYRDITAMLSLLRAGEEEEPYPRAFAAIEDEIFTRYLNNREALATGLLAAIRFYLPRRLRVKLAKSLNAAHALVPDTEPISRQVETALLEASILDPRRKPRAPAKKRKTRVKRSTAKKPSNREREYEEQLGFRFNNDVGQ